VNRLAEWGAMMAFAVLVVIVAVAVFSRYVLNDSIVWAEELARYLFIWITFLGGGLGVGRNIHVGVDSLTELLPSYLRKLVELAIEIVVAVFLIALLAISAEFARFGMTANALLLPIPIGWVYLAVPAGTFVMLANILLHIRRDFATLGSRTR
jgi:TRAP-type C4-dicarboxylate transport system permease small subunit